MFRHQALWKGCISYYLFTQTQRDHFLSGSICWSNTGILLIRHIHIKFSPTQCPLWSLILLIQPKVISSFRTNTSPAQLTQPIQGISVKVIFQPAELIVTHRLIQAGSAANTDVCQRHGQFWSPARIRQTFRKGKSCTCLQQNENVTPYDGFMLNHRQGARIAQFTSVVACALAQL